MIRIFIIVFHFISHDELWYTCLEKLHRRGIALNLKKIFFISVLLCVIAMTTQANEGKIQLLWPNAEDAVMYELEIDNVQLHTSIPGDDNQVVYTTTDVYTPGTELNLSLFAGQDLHKLYYRVRPLNLDRTPLADFSSPIALGSGVLNPKSPTPTALFKDSGPCPLYPVYSWIPVAKAVRYEVEVTSRLPENPNGVNPSKYRLRSYTVENSFDCYDQHPYTVPGTYYWRVIAFGADGKPIGEYSDAIAFRVQYGAVKWASFGDSITHGGGAISNPPSDKRYDYSAYLPFPVKNLGRSGDTAEALADRFETDVLPFHPQYLFILGGSNSIRGGVPAESVIASLETLREKCEAHGITPIFLTLPPLNPDRLQRVFNEPTADNWQEELAAVNDFLKTQPNVIDIYPYLADKDGLLPVKYSEDGLHPGIAGKKRIARCINAFLKVHLLP